MPGLGESIIDASGPPPFLKAAKPGGSGLEAPDSRSGDALRALGRSLRGFHKEALVKSAGTGDVWRLVSGEGPYLNGRNAAPCPLAFLTCGMATGFTSGMRAPAKSEGLEIRSLGLAQNNYCTMQGSTPRRTMAVCDAMELPAALRGGGEG